MSQQNFWNEKFSKVEYLYGIKPNQFIEQSIQNLPNIKTILCLGEGEGRNAIYLSSKNYDVTAIDASDVGLKKLQNRAEELNLSIITHTLDLNYWQPLKTYDCIVASYLHMHTNERKELFKKIEKSLNIDGYFIFEVFSTKQIENTSGGPKDLDLLYTLDEFKNYFEYMNFLKLEQIDIELNEGIGHIGKANVIRILAKRV